MKFVYNQEKTDHISDILMMKPSVAEAKTILDKDETDPEGWFRMGMALGLEGRGEEALEAYSRGILYAPFRPECYFGRGRRHNALGHYHAALADFTMAIQLDPSVWTFWYYRATAENMKGDLEASIADLEACIPLTVPSQRYVIVHWLYVTYAELGDYKKAEECLQYTDGLAPCQKRNYGYRRSVQLYKGIVRPEDYVDIAEMEREVLDQPGRVNLELNGMYYGLYWYWMIHGDGQKAKAALVELQKVAVKGAFGYSKSIPIAKRLGIIKED